MTDYSARPVKQCAQCGGTGKVILMNSMFITDPLRKERRGICAGSGESDYIGDREFAGWQRKQRASYPIHFELAEREERLRSINESRKPVAAAGEG